MKQDLATSVFAAVVGVLVAYFATNMFLPELEDVSFNTIADGESFALTDPNADIFNARAVNPTVEVYVGNCDEKDENGECLDGVITDGDGGSGDEIDTESEEEPEDNENKDDSSNIVPDSDLTPEPTPEPEIEPEEE